MKPWKTNEWRCLECGSLLGIRRGDRMHIRIVRRHEYLASYPVTATCGTCGSIYELESKETKIIPWVGSRQTF